MSKPSQRSPERKLQVVLSVLRGELSVAEAEFDAAGVEFAGHDAHLDTIGGLLAGNRQPPPTPQGTEFTSAGGGPGPAPASPPVTRRGRGSGLSAEPASRRPPPRRSRS